MPKNKNAMLRFRIIDGCLTNPLKSYPKLQYIKEKIEEQLMTKISESMINKDLSEMKKTYGAPIKYNKYHEGYCYTQPGFTIKEFPLTTEEISALDFSTALLHQLSGSKLFDQFENAINKVIEGYRISKIIGKSERQLIQVEEPVKTAGSQWLEPILKAIVEKKSVLLTYHKYGGAPTTHLFSPYILKEYRNRWYVAGYSARSERTLVLALDRMLELSASKEPYVNQPDFNPDEFFKYSFGITQIHDEHPEIIVLSFTPFQAPYIIGQPLHHSQKIVLENEKEIQISMNVYITQELIMSILSYGENVTVISPAHFRENIKERVKQMWQRYS
jgi:predicted DNA-binding transcriptional regulator YafY